MAEGLDKNKISFFYLAHGVISFYCLKDLIQKGYSPEFAVIHRDYEYDRLKNTFYIPFESLCNENNIHLYITNGINELKTKIKGIDVCICAGFMEILKKDFINIPKFGILNIHCGKLPNYRGRAPISRSIMEGEKYLTLTLHKMDEGVDSGDILKEKEIEINENDDVNILYNYCCENSGDLVIEGLNDIMNNNAIYKKQDLTLKPKANKIISDNERKIKWDYDILKIHNLIRAITLPYPCAYSTFKGEVYNFIKSEIFSKDKCNARTSGEVYFADDDYILINCIDGLLKVTEMRDKNNNLVIFDKLFKTRDIFE